MKRLLFVCPGLNYGGSASSLISILNTNLIQEYVVEVFSIVKGDNTSPVLANYSIGLNEWTSAFYSDFNTLSKKEKVRAVGLKILRQVPVVKIIVEKWIIRKTIIKLEKRKYDFVIAFQEGLATEFCQHFSTENKIAWIHCDYAKAYKRTDSAMNMYLKFKTIVCVSRATRSSFLNYYPTLADRTVVIYNIFDARGVREKALGRVNDIEYNEQVFSIISVGRINKVKRFDIIPRIARQLVERRLLFRWLIIGQPYSKEECDKLIKAIKEYGMEDYVMYLGGKPNPYPYFRLANLLVCVSESEACPMIFNEAKLLGLPIVTTNFPSAFEFICSPEEGMISALDNITETIANVIENKPFENQAKTYFDAEALNKRILSAINRVLDS